MSEERADYGTETRDAMEMLGAGYEIHPPSKFIAPGSDGQPEERTEDGWIKLSMAFLGSMKHLRGAKLGVWLAVALRINENYTSFPSIATIQKDTGLSNREVIDTIRELEKMGYLTVRRGERRYNIYRVNSFAAFGHSDPVIPNSEETSPVKSTHETVKSTASIGEETSLKQEERDINDTRGNSKKGDFVDGYIKSLQTPGGKRSMLMLDIETQIASRLRNNPTGKKWEKFIKYAADQQEKQGWTIAVFLDWLTAQKGFDLAYWPAEKMQEHYPRAFMETPRSGPEVPNYTGYVDPNKDKYVPNPKRVRIS